MSTLWPLCVSASECMNELHFQHYANELLAGWMVARVMYGPILDQRSRDLTKMATFVFARIVG